MLVSAAQILPLTTSVMALLFFVVSVIIIANRRKRVHRLRTFLLFNAFFTTILFFLTIIGFILVQSGSPFTKVDFVILFVSLVLTVSGLFLLRLRNKIPNNIYLLFTMVFQTYFVCEIALNVLVRNGYFSHFISISDPMLGTFNKPCVEPDLERGYRWNDEKIRVLKVVKGQEVFDNTFRVNNAGYYSHKDYRKEKSKGVKRFIVMGDSYTAAEFLKTPWPEATERFLQKGATLYHPELYSFALDGIGLSNWHSIFFNEIADQYKFDGLILAVYDDDLQRDFFMMYADSTHVYGSYSAKPPADMRTFEEKYKRSMYIAGNIENEAEINKKRQDKSYSTTDNLPASNLYILQRLYCTLKSVEYKFKRRDCITSTVEDDFYCSDTAPLTQLRKPEKIKMLDDIIRYCKMNNKEVILISVPHIEIVRRNVFKREKSMSQRELEFISAKYGLPYFDLYPYFEILPYDSLNYMYLSNDGHWNQQGSDYFAKVVATLLKPYFN